MTLDEERQIQPVQKQTGCGSATNKHQYEKMTVTPVVDKMEQCVLAGSITGVRIEINEVEVNEFGEDTSFPSEGFNASFD